jgi:hypothetical protein
MRGEVHKTARLTILNRLTFNRSKGVNLADICTWVPGREYWAEYRGKYSLYLTMAL